MANTIGELIQKDIDNLKTQEFNYQRLGIIFNLIELRHKSAEALHKRDLFLDIKKMIFYYVGAVDESYYGYYELNEENSRYILEKIGYLNIEQQINVVELLQRKLKLAGFADEAEDFDKHISSLKLKALLKKLSFRNLLKCISLFSTKNVFTLIMAIVIVYVFYSIILLPAPFKWMEFFKIDYVSYASNFILNHFLNTIFSFSQIDSDFSLTPKNFAGVILLIFIKVTILILLFNFLITELKRKFKI